ncbi:uncharacterized protein LTR77_007033 [Saxophila tyrrhenica]|uniref:NmrA-like domain-containing protein n=1 Tax=Saxophila tyrrhenica TaxID=1690608 RepID=A0AAV9P6V5_9PEZI|nr:hypothetical protein LTR77_007033 [Saxophila tyrrhenica]
MSGLRRLVVTGATGKQGGGLINALLDLSPQPFEIYAVTRNTTSGGSKALASKGVKLIQGDFENAEQIFKQVEKPWGLFSVTMPLGGAKKEEVQGKAMTKAALDAGIQHIIFTATDRGAQSDTDPTPIPHFASKFNIEKDIEQKAKASSQGATWTFLRPVAFYENLIPGFIGKGFVSMWRLNGLDNKVQHVSTKDIGKVAADAFVNASSPEYKNKAVHLAGDELSPRQMATIFKEVTGEEIPATYSWLATVLRWMLNEQLGIMMKWWTTAGFKTDVEATRKRYPFMQDFRSWLETDSAWAKKGKA